MQAMGFSTDLCKAALNASSSDVPAALELIETSKDMLLLCKRLPVLSANEDTSAQALIRFTKEHPKFGEAILQVSIGLASSMLTYLLRLLAPFTRTPGPI